MEKLSALIMKGSVRLVLVLIVLGFVLYAYRMSFFNAATLLIFITPVLGCLASGVYSIKNKDYSMSFASFGLFAVLMVSFVLKYVRA